MCLDLVERSQSESFYTYLSMYVCIYNIFSSDVILVSSYLRCVFVFVCVCARARARRMAEQRWLLMMQGTESHRLWWPTETMNRLFFMFPAHIPNFWSFLIINQMLIDWNCSQISERKARLFRFVPLCPDIFPNSAGCWCCSQAGTGVELCQHCG